MPRGTTFDEIYNTLGSIVEASTGRPWWKKGGIQSRPNSPYALVYLSEAMGIEKPVIENICLPEPGDNGEAFEQVPWGTSLIECRIEFYISRTNDSVLQAAQRIKASLYLTERYWDLWQITAISGGIRIIDLSQIFREDVEPRVEVRFSMWANIAEVTPFENVNIHDIDKQGVTIIHVRQDNLETEIELDTLNDYNDSSGS